MKTVQSILKSGRLNEEELKSIKDIHPQLILAFGSPEFFSDPAVFQQVKDALPDSLILGCSTAGEINNEGVSENTLVLSSASFARPEFRGAMVDFNGLDDSYEAGRRLGNQLKDDKLTSVFILGQGVNINGSAIIDGIRSVVGPNVVVTGGLAGDGGKFEKTFCALNDKVSDHNLVGIGIYNDSVKVSYGSMGGWEPFGPIRRVTKAKGNILYELDNEPALEVYKKYLGDYAEDLPGSGLLFPFAVLNENREETGLIRTILGVDEQGGSLTLAGDIPDGGRVRLMHAKTDGLVDGATKAAETTKQREGQLHSGLSVLVSCVGRKLVMGDEVEDEIDAVKHVLKGQTTTGFYSYGEICPLYEETDCKLHNQTMTITHFYDE